MGMTGVFRRIDGSQADEIKAGARPVSDLMFEESDRGLDVDKAWHGLNWLLCGDVWGTGDTVVGQAIMGGTEVGEELGYGKARLLDPSQVRACAAALAEVSVATLESRFDPQAMAADEVYPDVWHEGPGALEYLAAHFGPLQLFYADAAKAGDHVLLAVI